MRFDKALSMPSLPEEGSVAVVDTSFLVALHFEGDRFHRAAVGTELAGDRFLIPLEIWTEYADVVIRLAPPSQVSDLLASTASGPFGVQPVFRPEEYPWLARRAVHARATLARSRRKPLSFFDVVVCAAAERFREPILTFDDGITDAIRAKLFPGARLA